MNLFKICTAKPHSFLIIGTIPASHNYLHFTPNLSQKNIKTNHDY